MNDREMDSEDLIPIDPRSHLEVADRQHRYSKHLRLYYKEFIRISEQQKQQSAQQEAQGTNPNNSSSSSSSVTNNNNNNNKFEAFFLWLDPVDSSAVRPELASCPRSILDNDRVLYLRSDEEREPFIVSVDDNGLLRRKTTCELINTDSKGWIFVIYEWKIYACEKRTSVYPRFHHSSFFAGAPVQAAGMIVVEQGKIIRLMPHSGHYRPEDRQFLWLLRHLQDFTINLKDVKVDAQRVFKVSRQSDKDGAKMAKVDVAYYVSGFSVMNFLNIKAKALASGLLDQICSFDKICLRPWSSQVSSLVQDYMSGAQRRALGVARELHDLHCYDHHSIENNLIPFEESLVEEDLVIASETPSLKCCVDTLVPAVTLQSQSSVKEKNCPKIDWSLVTPTDSSASSVPSSEKEENVKFTTTATRPFSPKNSATLAADGIAVPVHSCSGSGGSSKVLSPAVKRVERYNGDFGLLSNQAIESFSKIRTLLSNASSPAMTPVV
eukprot:scaffold7649_cov165-Ochromonas_danica.AAC.6